MQFIIELLIDMFVYGFLDLPIFKSKLEKNIDQLKSEEWFRQLLDDARYSYIIWNNRRVKRFLVKDENILQLKTVDYFRKQFIDLVKHEHEKFVGIRKNTST